jgi:hypothetical protein
MKDKIEILEQEVRSWSIVMCNLKYGNATLDTYKFVAKEVSKRVREIKKLKLNAALKSET